MSKVLIYLIEFYQKYLSPLKGHPTCKYYPTCSEYARQAILIHGPFKGVILAAWRLLRCNPFSRGGYDPVPQPGLSEVKEVQ
ncbi:MAG TPA: membrane protein insertion efficiency factor YidD [Bacillota bacterium]|nr:membrane protein insertion efficiency factor YidD [Candidatus Fermentithermobacillaceae bacterium]HOB30761.1 membrane protein insertion efficiency factor YidD [Bacillota bacterium]HOK64882.1 membrane protein insertion efficiency factor YidD [Bacillota bacterium]HOL12575.1 membrane protein insertion efficiency factor YidD [Bacillota bacterium]HOQ03297.1 membrane protein insertion efficiency factor YidD [Bacillota bacterium]